VHALGLGRGMAKRQPRQHRQSQDQTTRLHLVSPLLRLLKMNVV
jgi:hypothetical protein